jgi:hypothetical protein
MITYLVISIIIIAFYAIGIKAVIKERRHKRRQLGIAEAYERFARQFKLAVDYCEFMSGRYIGLDRRNRKLVLLDHSRYDQLEQCICLYQVGECKIVHEKDESKNMKRVWLQLKNKRNNKLVRFCFYDQEFDPLVELASRVRKAIHWKTKVDIHKHPGNHRVEAEYVL